MRNDKCQMSNDKNTDYTEKRTQIPKPKIIISGVGTGGHYFPAVVVAHELLKRRVGVLVLVRQGYKEEKIAHSYGLDISYTKARPFYGKSIFQKVIFILSLMYSIYKLGSLTKKSIGLTFGGFGSLPLIISCLINRSPFYMFEPNRIPGRATQLFISRAQKVFLGLPLATSLKDDCIVTGIPIRQEFKSLEKKYSKKTDPYKKILFYGGSQGAQRLNRLALELQRILSKKYKIVIISGERDYHWVNSKRNGRTEVVPFTLTPWSEIEEADVIISRSGALAGYEILSSNKPVIFIPFPFAVDDHQYYNAEYFSSIGNATLIHEKDATEKIVAEKITELIQKRVERKTEIISDAEQRIVDVILKEN